MLGHCGPAVTSPERPLVPLHAVRVEGDESEVETERCEVFHVCGILAAI
jgi:hypothetical protein